MHLLSLICYQKISFEIELTVQSYVSLCIFSSATHRSLCLVCLHALYGDYSCSSVCYHCLTFLTFKTNCNSITNYSLYKMFQHWYERYLKGCCRAIRCLDFFSPAAELTVPKCRVFIWVQRSSNILIRTFVLCTLHKFKGEWIMLIPFSHTAWA